MSHAALRQNVVPPSCLGWARRVFLSAFCLLITGAPLWAESVRDPDHPPTVIQNRRFKMAHELTLEAGLLPVDAYYKGASVSLRYTWHINDFNAWDVLGVTYSYNWNSRLKESLIEAFAADPVADYEFREAVILVDSNYVLKPFYGKMAMFNRLILHSELQLAGGPAYALYTPSSTTFGFLSHRVGFNWGMAIRLFSAEWFSLRVDLKHYVLFAVDGLALDPPRFEIDNVLYVGLGGSFNIGYD